MCERAWSVHSKDGSYGTVSEVGDFLRVTTTSQVLDRTRNSGTHEEESSTGEKTET